MIKLKNILKEGPLGTYQTIGDFDKPASFADPRDRAAIKSPVTVEKLTNMLKNTTVDFDFYFVNKPGLRKFAETGRVAYNFIVDSYPNGLGLDPHQIKINEDNITVFFVGNTAADKIPMTAWTIAHRVGHVLNRNITYTFEQYTDFLEKEFDELLREYYNIQKPSRYSSNEYDYKRLRTFELAKGRLFNTIGTMRSARESKLHRRPFEFYYELFVQYLVDGKITFNKLTKNLLVGHGPFGHKKIAYTNDIDGVNEKLNYIANTIPYLLCDVLNENVGSIFVM